MSKDFGLTGFPHHDGSELYVSNDAPNIGDEVKLKVRIPHGYKFREGFIRVYEDAEPRTLKLKRSKVDSTESWYEVSIVIRNTTTLYRFVFIDKGKYEWLNAHGITDHDVHSNNDFQIVAIPDNPEWIHSSVFYQIFPIFKF